MFRPPGRYGGRYGGGYRGGHGHSRHTGYAVILLIQLLNQVWNLPWKPPVTIGLLAVQVLLFFGGDLLAPHPELRGLLSAPHSCLQPKLVLEGGQWHRLLVSAFLHADEYHLYYNMSSLLWKGLQLERLYGSAVLGAVLAELLLLSHGLTVLLAWLLADQVRRYRYLYVDSCAVGFSAVLFAMKVVLNAHSPGHEQIMGFRLPTKYMAWAELLLASYLNPRASFLGHLGGILAGLLHVKLIEPAVLHAMGLQAAPWRGAEPGGAAPAFGGGFLHPRQYFRGGGRLGGGGAAAAAPRAPRNAAPAAAPAPSYRPAPQHAHARTTTAAPAPTRAAAGGAQATAPPAPLPTAPPLPAEWAEPSAPPLPSAAPTAPARPAGPAAAAGAGGAATSARQPDTVNGRPRPGGQVLGGGPAGATHGSAEDTGHATGSQAALSAEELRRRRMQRFGGGS